jgi:hypothetical protein
MPVGPPVRLSGFPEQTGPLFEATATGIALTTTVVEALFWQPLLFITVRVYVPAIAVVAVGETVGFWIFEV